MRKIWDIPGGVHPPGTKYQSLTDAIGSLEKGDKVLKGQMIAEPVGFVSCAIHAPTSGTVAAIGDHPVPHPSGMTTRCIIIEPDGNDTWIEHEGLVDYLEAEPAVLHDRIRAAGIAGLGGAGFPSSVKLSPLKPIDTLIINGTECEPYITSDDILMQSRAGDIIEGVRILARILEDPEQVLIGVEDNKPRAFEALEAAAQGTNIEVVEFPTKYPSGGEKQIIQILTGREVPSGQLPAELGIIVQNTGTAYAACRAVAHGEPLISRITTVTGKACRTNRNYEVLLGTPIRHLLEHNGFDESACTRLVMGGPMMGFTLPGTEVPVIKTTNCILACNREESPLKPPPQQPCIRCGLCAEACPASLLPQQLFWYSQAQDYEKVQAYNLFDCIECGACAYVCPSNIPLVQYYRATKGELRHLEAEKRKADHARQRFEFHQARLEKAEAEKAAKREARRRAAQEAKEKAAQQNTPDGEQPGNKPGSADDLIRAAKAKAEARKASPEHQRAKLERGVEAAKNRLGFTEEKLEEARNEGATEDLQERLRAKVEEAKIKLGEAEKKLADFGGVPDPSASAPDTADIISGKLRASPREQLENKIRGLEERIATTEQKIAETGDESVKAALMTGLEKQQQKLADARQQLEATGDAASMPTEDPPAEDAAAKAIARARARAKAMAEMTPAQKLEANIESLEKRVEKASHKLEQAREEESEHLDTLTAALAKLEEKLAAARRELADLDTPENPR